MLKKIFISTSLKANIIANFLGSGWISLIGLLSVPVYLKYIGAEAYGLIGIFASLQIVFSILDTGLSTTLNKELAKLSVLPNTEREMRNLVKTLGTVFWALALLVGVFSICLSPFLARYWINADRLSVETISYAFILLSLSLIFQLPSGFYAGGLLGLQKQVTLNLARSFFATLRSVGAILILIFVTNSILVFFSWSLIIMIFQALVLRYLLWSSLPFSEQKGQFDKQLLKGVQRFALGMVGISLTAILLTQVDKIILSKILSLEQFGYYTIACSLGMMIYQVIGPLTQSYFPKFSSLVSLKKDGELKELYHQGCQLISLFVLPATMILIFFSKELIYIWTKSTVTTENTWLVTAIYAFGTGMNGLMNIPYMLTLASGWTKLGIYQNICFLAIMIPSTILLSNSLGAMGGALSWALTNTLYFFVTPILIHRKLLVGEVKNWYWKDSLKPMIASFTFIGLSKLVLSDYKFGRWFELIIIMIIGICSIMFTLLFTEKLKISLLSKIRK